MGEERKLYECGRKSEKNDSEKYMEMFLLLRLCE